MCFADALFSLCTVRFSGLFWDKSLSNAQKNVKIEVCRKVSKNNDLELKNMELSEWGSNERFVKWIEFIAYKGDLIWDVHRMCITNAQVFKWIKTIDNQ